MSTEISIAIIASVASLAVAIVSLLTAIISVRQNAHTNKEIEILRDKFTRRHSKEEFSDTYLNEALRALQESIKVIQRFKDEIQIILSATENSLDSDIAISRIEAAREEMFSTFEKNLPNLNEQEARAFHRSKNCALAVENYLRKTLEKKLNVSAMTKESYRRLIELRGQLTDSQQLLRDSCSDRLARILI